MLDAPRKFRKNPDPPSERPSSRSDTPLDEEDEARDPEDDEGGGGSEEE